MNPKENSIDLRYLYNDIGKEISIDQEIQYTKEDLKNTPLTNLKEVKALGKIYKNGAGNIALSLEVKGKMFLEDAISLEEIEYPFSFEMNEDQEEILKNNQNTLDLKEILWENIVLEIPLRVTKVKDFRKFQGDGWKLVEENENHQKDNPFSELLKEFGEE